jgi:hypothetical protein
MWPRAAAARQASAEAAGCRRQSLEAIDLVSPIPTHFSLRRLRGKGGDLNAKAASCCDPRDVGSLDDGG